jgi:hypothetical protein
MTFIVTFPLETQDGELTGRDIALKMDTVDTSKDYKRTAVMVIDRKGQELIRKMEMYTKKYGPDERRLIKFIELPDVRGIMYRCCCSNHWAKKRVKWISGKKD